MGKSCPKLTVGEKLGAEPDPPGTPDPLGTPDPGTSSQRGKEEVRAKAQPAPGRLHSKPHCCQSGRVPQFPPRLLCTSPSPPRCQQHLGGAPALTGLSFALPKILFHWVLNRTSPLQSPYPL